MDSNDSSVGTSPFQTLSDLWFDAGTLSHICHASILESWPSHFSICSLSCRSARTRKRRKRRIRKRHECCNEYAQMPLDCNDRGWIKATSNDSIAGNYSKQSKQFFLGIAKEEATDMLFRNFLVAWRFMMIQVFERVLWRVFGRFDQHFLPEGKEKEEKVSASVFFPDPRAASKSS